MRLNIVFFFGKVSFEWLYNSNLNRSTTYLKWTRCYVCFTQVRWRPQNKLETSRYTLKVMSSKLLWDSRLHSVVVMSVKSQPCGIFNKSDWTTRHNHLQSLGPCLFCFGSIILNNPCTRRPLGGDIAQESKRHIIPISCSRTGSELFISRSCPDLPSPPASCSEPQAGSWLPAECVRHLDLGNAATRALSGLWWTVCQTERAAKTDGCLVPRCARRLPGLILCCVCSSLLVCVICVALHGFLKPQSHGNLFPWRSFLHKVNRWSQSNTTLQDLVPVI